MLRLWLLWWLAQSKCKCQAGWRGQRVNYWRAGLWICVLLYIHALPPRCTDELCKVDVWLWWGLAGLWGSGGGGPFREASLPPFLPEEKRGILTMAMISSISWIKNSFLPSSMNSGAQKGGPEWAATPWAASLPTPQVCHLGLRPTPPSVSTCPWPPPRPRPPAKAPLSSSSPLSSWASWHSSQSLVRIKLKVFFFVWAVDFFGGESKMTCGPFCLSKSVESEALPKGVFCQTVFLLPTAQEQASSLLVAFDGRAKKLSHLSSPWKTKHLTLKRAFNFGPKKITFFIGSSHEIFSQLKLTLFRQGTRRCLFSFRPGLFYFSIREMCLCMSINRSEQGSCSLVWDQIKDMLSACKWDFDGVRVKYK